jgi:hypothetical protein
VQLVLRSLHLAAMALVVGVLQPAARLPWYLATTLVASVGSHISGSWRHFSFLQWKVMRPDR